jgi:hypothetical protein
MPEDAGCVLPFASGVIGGLPDFHAPILHRHLHHFKPFVYGPSANDANLTIYALSDIRATGSHRKS